MADITYCEWMTGFPTKFYDFIASFETNGSAVEFYTGSPVEIDWGDGKWLSYKQGNIHGFQANTYSDDPVVVRASVPVEEFRFGSGIDYDNGYLECNIHKAFDLKIANKLCYRLESMHTFSFFGTNQVEDFSSAWEDCTELTKFEGMDTSSVSTFKRAWKNCNKLITFPSVYSRKSNSMEETWMGCTSMVEFPIIGSELCTNFDSAWRGNVNLVDFPLINTGAGISFDHTWAYCINLLDFPVLDYSNAVTLSYTFAYNYKNRTLGAFNTKLGQDFTSMFEKNLALECITELDTRAISTDQTGDLLSKNMFLDDCLLVAPGETEQAELMVGSYYVNPEPCYFDAGRSTFFVVAQSTAYRDIALDQCATGADYICTFTVSGDFTAGGNADFEVDWGDGLFLPYNEGTVTGIPIGTGVINIRSEENVQQIIFDSDTYYDVSIKRGKTLLTLENLLVDKANLKGFSIYGNMIATNMNYMLRGCFELTSLAIADYSKILTMVSTFDGCTSLLSDDFNAITINVESCTDFTNTFKDCSSIVTLPVITSTVGEVFDNMFYGMISLTCLFGIDTRNQISTAGMFGDTPVLTRPNVNEITRILAGTLYNNGGQCGSSFDIGWTTALVSTTITTDVEVQMDIGSGTFAAYGPGQFTFTPTSGNCFLTGPVTTISFDTDTFQDVIFYNADGVANMSLMFKDKLALTSFESRGVATVTTWEECFMGCTNLVTFDCKDYSGSTTFTGTFRDCSSLTTVGYMNTIAGIEFEYMFSNCLLLSYATGEIVVGLAEINTLLGNFAKHYIACDTSIYDCNNDSLPCTPGTDDIACTVYYNCDPTTGDVFPCFDSSTMFENWDVAQIPNEADRIAIMSRAHWKEGEIL